MARQTSRFNRPSVANLSPVAGEAKAVVCSVTDRVKKYLTDIIVSCTYPVGGTAAPPIGQEQYLRIIVCENVGRLMDTNLSYVEFNPFDSVSVTEVNGSTLAPTLGNIYYDQVHILPSNNHIDFRTPIAIDESSDLIVAASYAVASAETITTAVAKCVHLSISGWIENSVQNSFEQR